MVEKNAGSEAGAREETAGTPEPRAKLRPVGSAVGPLTAATADRHELYERAVQDPTEEVELIGGLFHEIRGREARSLREDFCGTAALSAAWVVSLPARSAVGVDLDQQTLEWGRKQHVLPLGPVGERLELVCADVRGYQGPAVDVAVAMNFSYSLLHERRELVAYFERARAGLSPDGMFLIDAHAGPDTQQEAYDETEREDFTYVWEQFEMDAWSGRARRAIHFRFPDGSELRDAFQYDFRIWTLPELHDALLEAGFSSVELWTEDFDEDGYTVGELERTLQITHEDSWIAYLVALP